MDSLPNASNKCRICAAQKLRSLFIINGYEVFRCPLCSYVQISRKPTASELSFIYGTGYFVSNKYSDISILEKENLRRLKLLKRFMPRGNAKVLDAGCATGDFLTTAKREFRMYGCDISEYAVSEARRRNPELAARIGLTDLDRNEIPSERFDAICLWDVIEHLWDPVTICRLLGNQLKTGGFLFVSTPDIGGTLAKLMGRRWAFMTPPEHMGFFSKKSIFKLFGEILPFRFEYQKSSGKWTNFGFLLYKLHRVFPEIVSESCVSLVQKKRISRMPLYVPTRDIQYIVVRKVRD